MGTGMIQLKKTDEAITHNARDAYHVVQGGVIVYIVPWDEKTNQATDKRIRLCEVEEGRTIPSFAWLDPDHVTWRFALMSRQDEAALNVIERGATLPLKEKFLAYAGVDTFEIEGYERSLTEYYNSNKLNEKLFLMRGANEQPNIQRDAYAAITDAIEGRDHMAGHGAGDLYKALSYACLKGGMELAPLARLEKVCDELTIPEMARASHLICRDVTLDAGWYKSDCGILIASLEGRPVACVPGGRGYILYDPKEGDAARLTAETARAIDASAYSIRRTLPRRALKAKDMVAFVRAGLRRADILWLLGLNLVCTLIGVLLPKLNQLVYDEYIPLGDNGVLIQMGLVIAAFMIGNVFISLVRKLQEYRVPCAAGYELQDAMYQRAMELPEAFYRANGSADLAQRLTGFGSLTNQLVSLIAVNGFSTVISVVYLAQMIAFSGKLALVSCFMLLLYSLLLYALSRTQLRHKRLIAENNGEAVGKLYQFLGGVDKIRMAGAEERAILEYTLPVARETKSGIRSSRVSAAISILSDAGSVLFSMALYYLMVKGKMNVSTGSFLAFNAAFGAFTGSVMGFVSAVASYNEMKPRLERLRPFMEYAPEGEEGEDPVDELNGDVLLDHVTFAYSAAQGNVLNDLSLHIRPGEYVAIVGPSGCGKSTILKLLLGFETPARGKVCYDGRNLASLDKHMLRRRIGVVLQNGRLIAGSIFENITITSPHAKMEDVMRVIRDVGLKDDINAMPMGVHTVLSESGNTISGGQQQRILIARAICNNPPILYFDEATSALDNVTQAMVCQSLEARHMTRVVIAHRLSTVINCDRIVVIDGGRVSEEGSYDELMAKKGLFYQMAIRQIAE